jgi:hypothetical protein
MYGDKRKDQQKIKTMNSKKIKQKFLQLQNEIKMIKYLNFIVFSLCFLLLCLLGSGCKSKQTIVGTTSQCHTNTTTTTIFKDTIIDVHFSAKPPVLASIPIQDIFTSDSVFAETSTAKAFAFITNGKLHLSIEEKDTIIPVRIPNAIRETTTNQTTDSKETIVVEPQSKKHFTGTLIERILLLLGLILLIILGIRITHKRGVK